MRKYADTAVVAFIRGLTRVYVPVGTARAAAHVSRDCMARPQDP